MSENYEFLGCIAEWKIQEWENNFAPLNVRQELEKMVAWLKANPKRRKRTYLRFINGWLNKAHAQVVVTQVNARMYARVGENRNLPPTAEQQEEVKRLKAKYPDLAEGL